MPDPSARPLPSRPMSPSAGPEASSHGHLFANWVRLETVDSTNRYLVDAARDGAPEGAVVVAELQTAGRGRRGRHWLAPEGSSLLCSFLFRPVLAFADLHLIPTVVGLAVHAAIGAATGGRVDLKWPNDVLIGGKKVGGILSEIVTPPPGDGEPTTGAAAVVVGVGVNLIWPDGFPAADGGEDLAVIADSATTLAAVAGHRIDRDGLLAAIASELESRYTRVADAAGRREVMAEYRRVCSTPGHRVTISEAAGDFEADALSITDEGRLLVMADGHPRAVDSADVVHLRTAD